MTNLVTLFPAFTAFCLSLFAIKMNGVTAAWREDLSAAQAMHLKSASRFGGLAIFLALTIYMVSGLAINHIKVVQIFLCALPLLAVGLCEDAGWRLHPYLRLTAGAVSSLLAVQVCGVVIERWEFLPLNAALNQHAVGIAFTVLALTGVSQSFNLLDGLHGICALTSTLIVLSLVVIATKGGQEFFGQALIPVATAILGFLALNFPRGLIFLGDAGATCLGFILISSAVELLKFLPNLSAFAIILTFFWPIADTFLAIARRMMRNKSAIQPDRMHFHHVVKRSLEILVLGNKSRPLSNPIATVILMPFIALPSIMSVVLWNRNELAITALLIFAALFVITYWALLQFVRKYWKRCRFGRRSQSSEMGIRKERVR